MTRYNGLRYAWTDRISHMVVNSLPRMLLLLRLLLWLLLIEWRWWRLIIWLLRLVKLPLMTLVAVPGDTLATSSIFSPYTVIPISTLPYFALHGLSA